MKQHYEQEKKRRAHAEQMIREMSHESNGRAFNDIVHGPNTRLPPIIWKIVDTPIFQRLRYVAQLGTMPFVFPNATHSRFEHSLGVAFLAGEWCKIFRRNQPELNITELDIHLVQIAGLLHDLGHGPFSHAFENGFVSTLDETQYNTDWCHEDASEALMKTLLLSLNNDGSTNFTKDHIEKIRCMIRGEVPTDEKKRGRTFLYQIVSNRTNSIDVDKFDYLRRDSMSITPSYLLFSMERLMSHSRVIDGEICFRKGQEENIYMMFISRFNLHKQIYTHRAVVAVDLMIGDIFKLADPVFGISDIFKRDREVDYERYRKLDDTILREIERHEDPRLEEAHKLLIRLRKRKLYKWVAWFPVESRSASVKQAELEKFLHEDKGLSMTDFVIHRQKFNFALKDKNPMANCLYYKDDKPNCKFEIPPESVSELMIKKSEYNYLSVFVKRQQLFDNVTRYLEEYGDRYQLMGAKYSPKITDRALTVQQGESKSPLNLGRFDEEAHDKGVTQLLDFDSK